MKDLVKVNDLIEEAKEHSNFSLKFVPLDLDSCGLLGVTDASLGGVDKFGTPTADESKTVKVYSQAGTTVMLAEQPLLKGGRGRFNVLECMSRTIPRVCRSSMASETRGLAMLTDSVSFFEDALRHVLGGSVLPRAPTVLQRQSGISWPKTVVTDARDVYDRLSKETGGLPEQKALTMEIAGIREWMVATSAELRWTADENMINDGLTKDKMPSRRHLARIFSLNTWSIEKATDLLRSTAIDGCAASRQARRKQSVSLLRQ